MAPSIGEVATVVRGRYTCPVCDRRFILLADKKAHIRIKHPKGGQ